MNILLTNDDGYDSVGLIALKDILAQYGEVYTVAPYTHQSGKGCGLTSFNGLKVYKKDDKTFLVDGTPVDCLHFASLELLDKIDLIVSGCNNGFNLSNNILYSGTCGACFQSLIFDKKAIAFSSDKYKDDPWQLKQSAKAVLDYIFNNNLLSTKYFLNVNFPRGIYEKPKGIKLTKLYRRHTKYEVISYDEENSFYSLKHTHDDIHDDDTWDVSAVGNGYISITPISLLPFEIENYNEIIKK